MFSQPQQIATYQETDQPPAPAPTSPATLPRGCQRASASPAVPWCGGQKSQLSISNAKKKLQIKNKVKFLHLCFDFPFFCAEHEQFQKPWLRRGFENGTICGRHSCTVVQIVCSFPQTSRSNLKGSAIRAIIYPESKPTAYCLGNGKKSPAHADLARASLASIEERFANNCVSANCIAQLYMRSLCRAFSRTRACRS